MEPMAVLYSLSSMLYSRFELRLPPTLAFCLSVREFPDGALPFPLTVRPGRLRYGSGLHLGYAPLTFHGGPTRHGRLCSP